MAGRIVNRLLDFFGLLPETASQRAELHQRLDALSKVVISATMQMLRSRVVEAGGLGSPEGTKLALCHKNWKIIHRLDDKRRQLDAEGPTEDLRAEIASLEVHIMAHVSDAGHLDTVSEKLWWAAFHGRPIEPVLEQEAAQLAAVRNGIGDLEAFA